MQLTQYSETSAHKIQMPRNHPKERIQQESLYIYFIIQFRQHNIKVKVTATCFDLTSHLQAYLRIKTNYTTPVHIWDPRWLTMCVGIRI